MTMRVTYHKVKFLPVDIAGILKPNFLCFGRVFREVVHDQIIRGEDEISELLETNWGRCLGSGC